MLLPVGQLPVQKISHFVFQNESENLMLRIRSLDHHFALFFPSPCTAAHLCNQLESSFIRTKIREVHKPVCVKHPHEADSIKIQSFGHHLRSYQHVRLTTFKPGN